ncbi:uncharacterized protein LOC119662455 [Teleopsis dalmanni]|uniref:uncharacterized protein LOC119662455 n=1 Tax=Teleopsis dalmanni TaxID=139649 RepID=UPI0018CDBA61|nr:uncharacterized protein LOC119662455 [Teleopsis dalmanni]
MKLLKYILLTTLITVVQLEVSQALQCHVCDNCADDEDLQELHICEVIIQENSTTIRPVTLPEILETNTTVAPSIANTTARPSQNVDSEDNYDDYSEEYDSKPSSNQQSTRNTTTRPPMQTTTSATTILTTIRTTTTRPNSVTTTRLPSAGNSDYDNYDYDDQDYDGDRRSVKRWSVLKAKMARSDDESWCYILKYKVNDTLITKRGCTPLVDGDKSMTCNAVLGDRIATLEDCNICNINGCNKHITDETESDIDTIWNAASSQGEIKLYLISTLIIALWAFSR